MSTIVITLKTEFDQATAKQRFQLDTTSPKEEARALAELFHRAAGNVSPASFDVQTSTDDPVAASATVTIDYSKIAATDALTIGPQAFTCVASGATTNQFNKQTNATTTAANLADAINASDNTDITSNLVASAANGIVTITAKSKGTWANLVTLAKSEGVSGSLTLSATNLSSGAGGAEEAAVSYSCGI